MIKGTGIDIIKTERIKNLSERWGERFLYRVFTPSEIDYCSERKCTYQHYAGRFAAKEAVIKVLARNFEHLKWRDIEIISGDSGKPEVFLHQGALSIAHKRGIEKIHISITHEKEYALAQAIGEGGWRD